jgi:hypothetical protein
MQMLFVSVLLLSLLAAFAVGWAVMLISGRAILSLLLCAGLAASIFYWTYRPGIGFAPEDVFAFAIWYIAMMVAASWGIAYARAYIKHVRNVRRELPKPGVKN